LFCKGDHDVGLIKNYTHSIITESNAVISLPTRRIPIHLEDEVNKMVEELLKMGIIKRSQSPFNNPLVVVPKKNGKLRICVDFRRLNLITKREVYPIPECSVIFDQLGGHSYFSTLDLAKGYYQVQLDKASQEKTAFSTASGHYEFVRMPFGLTNAPASFQCGLERVLRKHLGSQCCVYIDDIIVFGRSKTEHDNNLYDVLQTLRQNNIKLSREKCSFKKSSVKYLGHIISKDGISTDPEKIKAVKNWPQPKTMKELNRFLGFANYYRKFVKNYSDSIRPLEDLATKEKKQKLSKLIWLEVHEKSFNAIKSSLVTAPILHIPSKDRQFILDTDCSTTCMGAVLSQLDENGQERPIYFASNKLSPTEQKYCTTRRELLAVVKYIKFFHHYLAGKRFILRTDHKSLSWLMTWKTPSTPQYFAWISMLQMYDFSIVHRSGFKHANADALSRLNICSKCKVSHINSIDNIKDDCDEVELVKQCLLSSVEPQSNSKWTHKLWKLKNKLLVQNGKLLINLENFKMPVVSKRLALKTASLIHCTFGHIGSNNLYRYLKSIFWCPNLRQMCKNVCQTCLICLKRKSISNYQRSNMKLDEGDLLEKIYMDVAGPLPDANGYRYLLVILDSFSNYPCLIPIKDLKCSTIAKLFFNEWISKFGAPLQLHSDNAPYFFGPEMKQLFIQYGIKHSRSSPYHPQSNGKIERLMRTIKDMLYGLCTENKSLWVNFVPRVEMSFRGLKSDENGVTPFHFLYGRQMRMSSANHRPIDASENAMKAIYEKLESKESNGVSQISKIKVGSIIMARILPKTHSIYKPRYSGPFKVLSVKSQGRKIEAIDQFGEKVVRNVADVKLVSNIPYLPMQDNSRRYEAVYQNNSHQSQRTHTPPIQNDITSRYPSRIRRSVQRYGFDSF